MDTGRTNVFSSNELLLYHGSDNQFMKPKFGFGSPVQDYGLGLYTTQDIELAKEWAVGYRECEGWVHSFRVDTTGLNIFNFKDSKVSVFSWLAELTYNRAAYDSRKYLQNCRRLQAMYKLDLADYDIIIGWRADASYFDVAKAFLLGDLDYHLFERALRAGNLGIQICIKSERAFKRLTRVDDPLSVDKAVYTNAYYERDSNARQLFDELLNSPENDNLNYGIDSILAGG